MLTRFASIVSLHGEVDIAARTDLGLDLGLHGGDVFVRSEVDFDLGGGALLDEAQLLASF